MRRIAAVLTVALGLLSCASTGTPDRSAGGSDEEERVIELYAFNPTGAPIGVYFHGESGRRGTLEPGANCEEIRLPGGTIQNNYRLGLKFLGESVIYFSASDYPFGKVRFWMIDIKNDPELINQTFQSLQPGPECAERDGDSSNLERGIVDTS